MLSVAVISSTSLEIDGLEWELDFSRVVKLDRRTSSFVRKSCHLTENTLIENVREIKQDVSSMACRRHGFTVGDSGEFWVCFDSL